MFTNYRFSVLVALAAFCVCLTAHGAETVELAPHTFTIPDGYELKRVAAPPLVQRPMHMYFDVDGVLYVTDSSGNTDKATVQLKDPQHRVLRLVDRDGDGVFDQSTVFADKLCRRPAAYLETPRFRWGPRRGRTNRLVRWRFDRKVRQ
jgi:hypothetical protein